MLVQKFPNSLKSLLIKGCLLVEHFLGIICNTQPTCLQSLDISDCACSLSIPGHHLPKSLKELRIQNCRNLEFAATQCMWLESLEIHDSCDFLTFFPLNTFPNLKHLVIKGCLHLETLMPPLQLEDSTLDSVTISCCPNFVNFPRFAAPNLTSFRLIQCPMMSLPSDMNILLPKLEFLSIWDGPTLDMDLVISLPPNLQTLYIMNDKYLLRHLSLMGMHEGITFLSIGSISMSVSSFPKVGLLPHFPSLATLVLYGFEYMEALDCDGLLHLTSLIALQIGNCPKLKSVKGERLPSSLLKLEIYATPFLEELCNEKHPHIWSKISHIPSIRVNERWVS
ncbi:hypothetical protein RJT34_15066 [Clitoria ternatea]|uniref:Uncharacterized protein n=1 Tax=Clitoria ternatea TaxID=43366 RepID=A0AAN9JRV4_CLITE